MSVLAHRFVLTAFVSVLFGCAIAEAAEERSPLAS